MNKYLYNDEIVGRMKPEKNKATVYDNNNLNELTSWGINEMGRNMIEA